MEETNKKEVNDAKKANRLIFEMTINLILKTVTGDSSLIEANEILEEKLDKLIQKYDFDSDFNAELVRLKNFNEILEKAYNFFGDELNLFFRGYYEAKGALREVLLIQKYDDIKNIDDDTKEVLFFELHEAKNHISEACLYFYRFCGFVDALAKILGFDFIKKAKTKQVKDFIKEVESCISKINSYIDLVDNDIKKLDKKAFSKFSLSKYKIKKEIQEAVEKKISSAIRLDLPAVESFEYVLDDNNENSFIVFLPKHLDLYFEKLYKE